MSSFLGDLLWNLYQFLRLVLDYIPDLPRPPLETRSEATMIIIMFYLDLVKSWSGDEADEMYRQKYG